MASVNLNPNQEKAVKTGLKPLIIVAGAGTGKTRTLTSRLAHLIHMGADPGSICAITFTNKAAKEMLHRVQQLTIDRLTFDDKRGGVDRQMLNVNGQWLNGAAPFIGTFHSLGARILRAEAAIFGRTDRFVIFDDHDSFDAIKKILREKYGVQKRGTTAKDKVPAPSFFREAISGLKSGSTRLTTSGMKTVENIAESNVNGQRSKFHSDVPDIFLRYEELLRRHNAFDFDDLIEKVVLLF
ncbi:MAG: UvrD-helicase domain-containing protein, partial [bacterium]|nr:UvrD-helicase domain-containing protein [bacterium]